MIKNAEKIKVSPFRVSVRVRTEEEIQNDVLREMDRKNEEK